MFHSLSTDRLFTVQNVTAVVERVTVEGLNQVWKELLGDDVIEDRFSNLSRNLQAASDIYINCKPDSSWEELVAVLYEQDRGSALDRARPFIPPKGEVFVDVMCQHESN